MTLIKSENLIFAELPFEVTYLENEGITLDPEETGSTFEENAILKARAFVEISGLLTLAEDSGLEVDALDKRPGVYSKRYGDLADNAHEGRCHLILQELASLNISDEARTARFRCVIAIADPEGKVEIVEGHVEGLISHDLIGNNGFGYDPIFFVPEIGKTFAQLESSEKNEISHRGRATRKAVPVLQKLVMVQN
ncbi:MAG: non-canonical purine NTP pyrophosphatase, RdgB/HAM1 family [Anaerolineaceae bacterium 4572_78]|nr:MAG: non-canonical purine NTP pyrophosphatase, RdgB/HAM1 family [Anaerolineaceae bacterium 4572_78]